MWRAYYSAGGKRLPTGERGGGVVSEPPAQV